MKSKKNRMLVLLALLSLSVTLIIITVWRFMYSIIETKTFRAMLDNTVELMEVIRDISVENIEYQIQEEKDKIAENARLLENMLSDEESRELSSALNCLVLADYGIDYLFYQEDGSACSAKGTDPALYEIDLKAVWDGEIVMDGPSFREDGSFTMVFSAPVYLNGRVEGVLCSLMEGEYLSKWIEEIQFPSDSVLAYIVNPNGTNIAVSTPEYYEWFQTGYNAQKLAEEDKSIRTVADLERKPLQGETGIGYYMWEGERNYLAYAPVKDTGWGLFVGVWGVKVLQSAREITSGGVTANQVWLIVLVLILCVISILEVRWIGREQRDKKVLIAQKEALAALQKKTQEQAALLMEHNQIILSSLDYAKKIQNSLLPGPQECKGELAEFGLIWNPKDAVGGDLYWIRHFAGGAFLCVCDCTGHGVPGAMLTMLVATALDAVVDQENYRDPAEVMWQLERKLVSVLNAQPQKEEKSRMAISDGADLALMYIGRDNSVALSSGNMHVFVCDGRQVRNIKGQRLHIGEGALKSKEQIQTVRIPADKRNRYYIATDGYYDQIGGVKGLPFGYRAFREIILEHHEEEMDAVIERLWDAFEQYRGTEPRRDDVELVGFRA